ncbi:superoxide dismutase [Bacteroides caecigallinarum]|uniref:superoxide dismutase n=1 Tax=Bacteroides caecigallinarum TaxID=1411144 RepID=UPI001957ACE7|nr:superoxide dismutase [Bacteroides caecigallinarum]MBM6889635.1 superoxide dismutase [Bacteroides caecigallinarum]MCF2553497.1 superoxide dismutase [Bacteroides caecigallinarum]
MTHTMPQLPYDVEALAPKMSKETFDYHYGKHLQTYVNNLNKFIAGTEFEDMKLEDIICKAQGPTFNNAAQTWNHTFFFMSLTPNQEEIPSTLSDKLNEAFGSVEKFKEEFTKSATGLFGSGWTWLVKDKENKLKIVNTTNAGNPLTDGLTPLMVIDVWEHAYYIDYRNNRAAFIEAFWSLIDWNKVAERL